MAFIYQTHFDNVGKSYIGSSLHDNRDDYFGSMSQRGQARMEADHARAGQPILRRREILWQGPADDTLLSREYALITERGTNHPDIGYNLMPMLVGVNIAVKFNWKHDPITHVDSTDCPYGLYRKLQAQPDVGDTCSYCKRPWGEQTRGLYWLEFTDLDGNTEQVTPPGFTKGHAVYTRYFRAHKDKMIELLGLGLTGSSTPTSPDNATSACPQETSDAERLPRWNPEQLVLHYHRVRNALDSGDSDRLKDACKELVAYVNSTDLSEEIQ